MAKEGSVAPKERINVTFKPSTGGAQEELELPLKLMVLGDFLTGRLRQKLDDELPELTHSLMHILWPNYMRPLPAFSMLQFDPVKRPGPALMVPRNTPVESKPIQGVTCRFRTAYATEVLPLALDGLDYSVKGGGALLSLRLQMTADGHLGELNLKQLRLHLAGERYISQMLYLSLLRNVAGVQLVALDAKGKPFTDGFGVALPALERRFEPLHRLLDDNNGASAELVPTLQALDALQLQLAGLAHASAPDQAAFELAKARMGGQRDAINQLRASAARLPQPIGNWLGLLAEDSWSLVLNDAYHYLNQRYQSELFTFYKGSLRQRYPFSAHSESDVAIADFREFFKTQGVADGFFDRYLKHFVSGSAGQYQLRRVDGRGLPLSREFLAQMSNAQTIRRSFFAENPNEPQVRFKLEPYSLDSSLGRADFRFGSQQMEYRHGPIVQTAFSWPADADEGRTSLVVEELGGRRVGIEKNTGPWSLFRLLDLMQVDYHSGRDVLMLKANLGGRHANYLLHSQRSPNPFDIALLRDFKLPATL